MTEVIQKEEFDEWIMELLKEEIDICLYLKDGLLWYDLNTCMKSDLHIAYDANKMLVPFKSRYDTGFICTFSGLLHRVNACHHGRPYANPSWESLLKNKGVTHDTTQTRRPHQGLG